MRPVSRGGQPASLEISTYRDALQPLLSAISTGTFNGMTLGHYCSYCERKLPTNIAIEHIEPKELKPELLNSWSNFLLACVNCNSAKGHKPVDLNLLYFPDRDNTYLAFEYEEDGRVSPSSSLTSQQSEIATNTIEFFKLNKYNIEYEEIATDRRSQRLNTLLQARDSLSDYVKSKDQDTLRKAIIKEMLTSGFFSIWMKVFDDYPDIKNDFINAIKGTKESGCFNSEGVAISPHPNSDGLASGGKI